MATSSSRAFLSTSPARGTTLQPEADYKRLGISIHVPREGDDVYSGGKSIHGIVFLSTSPARGTTPACGFVLLDKLISIHVPREGDDAA